MIACMEMRLRLRPARRAGPTTDTRGQTHSGVGVGSSPLAGRSSV